MKKIISTLCLIILSPLSAMNNVGPEQRLASLIKNAKKNKITLNRAEEIIHPSNQSYIFNFEYRFQDEEGNPSYLIPWALKHDKLDIAELLIHNRPPQNSPNKASSLIYACYRCNEIYANMHTGGNNAALEMEKAIALCRILLAQKGAAQIINNKQSIPYQKDIFILHQTAQHRNYELCKLLLDHGADVNLFDCYLNTASSYACLANWKEGLKLFLTYGASLEFRDLSRYTLLMNAANQKKNGIIEMILEHVTNSRKAAKTLMLCLYRMHRESQHPCLQLLTKQGKSLLQRHVLKACAEYNKTMLLAQLNARSSNGDNAFARNSNQSLNPANIDTTFQRLLTKDMGGTQG